MGNFISRDSDFRLRKCQFLVGLVGNLWEVTFVLWEICEKSLSFCGKFIGSRLRFVGNLWATNFVLWDNGFDLLELRCPIGSVGYNSRFVGNIFFSFKLYFSILGGGSYNVVGNKK